MKRRHLCLTLFLSALASSILAQSKKPLTNDDVIQLVKAQLQDKLIVRTIETQESAFDLSSQGLVALKNAGVPDAVLGAMLEARAKGASAPPSLRDPAQSGAASPSDDIPAGLPAELGVFVKGGQGWVRLDESEGKREQDKSFATRLTGFGSLKLKAIYKGSRAAVQLSDGSPTFYIRTPVPINGASILRFDAKKNSREVQYAALNSTEYQELSGDVAVRAAVKQVGTGVFAIESRSRLTPGEYILTFSGGRTGHAFGITGP